MKFSDIIEIIWRNLWERKGRTILTMIGVIIGSIAIYVIVSIGNGFQDFTSSQFNSMANNLTIFPYTDNPMDAGSKNIKNKKKILTEKNINELEKLNYVKYAVPKLSTNISANYKKNNLDSLQLSGMKMKYYSKDHELSLGKYPNDSNKNQVVIGQKLAAALLNIKDTSNLKPKDLEEILTKKIELEIPEENLPSEKAGQSSNSKDADNISEDNSAKVSQSNSNENSNEEASLNSNKSINNNSDTNNLEDTETKTEPDESNSSNLKENNNQTNLKSENELNKNTIVDNSASKESSKKTSDLNTDTNSSNSSYDNNFSYDNKSSGDSTEDLPIENSSSSDNTKSKTYKVKVVGILKEGMANDYSMQSSLGLVQNILDYMNPEKDFLKEKGYQSIDLILKDTQSVDKAEKHLKSNGYSYSSSKDFQSGIDKILTGIKLILGSFGGISLLVAAFGIANTMNMSILERKKEIGIMKVVGASVWDVKKIFIGESTAIGFMGGLIGIVVGFIICLLINIPLSAKLSTSSEKVSIISFSIGLVAFVLLFSSFIGFLSGLYPASKAAKLNVIDSIKDQ